MYHETTDRHQRIIAAAWRPTHPADSGIGFPPRPGRLTYMSDRDPEESSPSAPRVPGNPGLDDLRAQFDALLETMQGPEAREAVDRALGATGAEMGRAAVVAARGAATPIRMRHLIRVPAEIQTATDLASHFRDVGGRLHDDPALAAALVAAARGLDCGSQPGQIASNFELQAANASEFIASALRGVAEALRRIAGPPGG